MAKYRKKPIVIEAVQWFPGVTIDDVKHDGRIYRPYQMPDGRVQDVAYTFIETLEGRMEVTPGDWVITGVAGEKYPCKDSIFRQTYEAVEDA